MNQFLSPIGRSCLLISGVRVISDFFSRLTFPCVGIIFIGLMSSPANSCTTAVISGKFTADGRPLLWKNRDAPHRHNEVVLFNEGIYRSVAVVNAGSRSTVWMGVNSAGLCIENSLSKDLQKEDETNGPGNGRFMKQILQTCATLEEVLELLDSSNATGRSTRANFGVIDADGGAGIIEAGPRSYKFFDANDPDVAPNGYLIRTNFSTTAQSLRGSPAPAEVNDVYSARRYLHACQRLAISDESKVDLQYVLRKMTRDLSDESGQPYSGTVNSDNEALPPVINTSQTISRTTTVSAAVFQGVRPGEDPQLTTMWTILGDPKFSIAVPCWAAMETVADPMEGESGGEIGEIALTLRGWSLKQDGTSVATKYLPGIWNDVWTVEDILVQTTKSAVMRWRNEGVTSAQLTRLHHEMSAKAMRAMERELVEMKNAAIVGAASKRQTKPVPDRPSTGNPRRTIRVGLYDDVGVGSSQSKLMAALQQMDKVYVTYLDAQDIRGGHLEGIDVLIHPGGSGGKQGRHLGERGREVIRDYVREGGGFIGICAGAYLASANYPWSLNLLDAKVFDTAHWARGTGNVEIELFQRGQQVFQSDSRLVRIFYGQGPLLVPASRDEIPDYEPLAVYRSEIAKKGAPRNVMPGTTAIAAGSFGRGRVLCFSPHPELTDGLGSFVREGVHLVARKRSIVAYHLPKSVTAPAAQTPDISQKELANAFYCAPCAGANLLYQFEERGLMGLPQRFTSAAGQAEWIEARRRLALRLGESQFMETFQYKGTNRYRLVQGLDRFLRNECDAELESKYLGVRHYDRSRLEKPARGSMSATVGIPQLKHLKQSLADGCGVIILFGSYKPNPKQGGRLERVGGHYVSAVGFGKNSRGLDDESCIILHDSNDSHLGKKFVRAQAADEEVELWDKDNRLAKSADLVELENAPIKKDGRVAFLETIFSFQVAAN